MLAACEPHLRLGVERKDPWCQADQVAEEDRGESRLDLGPDGRSGCGLDLWEEVLGRMDREVEVRNLLAELKDWLNLSPVRCWEDSLELQWVLCCLCQDCTEACQVVPDNLPWACRICFDHWGLPCRHHVSQVGCP